MSNVAIAMACQEEHLILERVAGQRPSVAEHDRLTFPAILVVDLGTVIVFIDRLSGGQPYGTRRLAL